MISVQMVKICSDSIWEPLKLILLSYFDSGNLSSESKIVIVVPFQRRMVSNSKNYPPISIIYYYWKNLERLSWRRSRLYLLDISKNLYKTWFKVSICK